MTLSIPGRIKHYLTSMPTFANFAVGGGGVAAVGLVLLVGLVRLGVPKLSAYAIQLVVTFALNFLYNYYATFRNRPRHRLLPQIMWFVTTRAATQVLSWLAFELLQRHHVGYLTAYVLCLAGAMALNFVTSDKLVFCESPDRRMTRQAWQSLARWVGIGAVLIGAGALIWRDPHLALLLGLAAAAVFCFVLGSAETYWRNYCWWTPNATERFAWPSPVPASSASLCWSVVVPALNESASIEATINQLVRQDHPRFEVVVSLCSCDTATIEAVKRAKAAFPGLVRPVIGDHREFRRHRKAYQLNRAIATLPTDDKHIVLIADAEGGVQPALLRHMEAVFKDEGCDVVQGGVQLMNLGRWFQVFAAMEYAAWFEGNMARQAKQGVVLFGGNTVAFTTSHLAQIGGIPDSLTEDGAAGIRSAMVGANVAVCYSPELCTRELSPPTLFDKQLGSLFFQRVRWVQGYFHELIGGHWLKLPTWSQRRSAAFGLASPVLQSVSSLLLPLAIITAVTVKVPLVLALAAFVPLVPYSLTIWAQVMHLGNFGRRFQQKVRLRNYLTLIFLSPIYQVILMSASAVAVCRHLTGQSDWYKTGREHDQTEIALTVAESASA